MGKAKAAVRSGVLTLRVWASSWRLPAVRAGSAVLNPRGVELESVHGDTKEEALVS